MSAASCARYGWCVRTLGADKCSLCGRTRDEERSMAEAKAKRRAMKASATELRDAFREWHRDENDDGARFERLCRLMGEEPGVTKRRRLVRVYWVVKRTFPSGRVGYLHVTPNGAHGYMAGEPRTKLSRYACAAKECARQRVTFSHQSGFSVVRVSVFRKMVAKNGK